MNKVLSAALLAAGIILLVLGVDAYHSANSVISRFFNGEPSNKALWLLISGGAACAAGLTGLVKK